MTNDRDGHTLPFRTLGENGSTAMAILESVYAALKAKGYDPVTQIVGYLISGDPTYITSFNGARSLICRLERDEILEELTRCYLEALDRK
ncbi:MAG: IreB family regulatory phosphoprotein [Oscillospiraceae bacterium]|nr:IreB family regulatory phosphoprotein [Oscillospiraceae bacterium]